jgi:ABC-type lipoprotein export system ATPase subunit
MNEPFLTASNLHKAYTLGRRNLEVLKGVSLKVAAGEFTALRGASGAGKSTLLHLLGGLDRPDDGTVQVDGQLLDQLDTAALSRFRNRHIGFIFQAFHLLPELDACENVALPARISRISAPTAAARAKELLARVGLADRIDHRPLELSGGEQQRVAIARALINEPELILADEPTGNLDSHTGEEIIQLLLSLQKERSATLVIATHDLAVAQHAQAVFHLVDGQLADSP